MSGTDPTILRFRIPHNKADGWVAGNGRGFEAEEVVREFARDSASAFEVGTWFAGMRLPPRRTHEAGLL